MSTDVLFRESEWVKALNKCSDRRMEVQISDLLGNYDRQAIQLTNRLTNQPTDRYKRSYPSIKISSLKEYFENIVFIVTCWNEYLNTMDIIIGENFMPQKYAAVRIYACMSKRSFTITDVFDFCIPVFSPFAVQ